jgi:uncharacterized protein (DUF58 family)
MPIPSWRLAVVAVIAGVVLLVLPGDAWLRFVAAVALVAVVFTIDAIAAVSPRALQVDRAHPSSIPLGATGEVTWTVRNESARAVRASVADELAPSLQPASRRFEALLPPNGHANASTLLHPQRRGLFVPTDVVVRTEGPLRLAARQSTHESPTQLRVVPTFRSREQATILLGQARVLEMGLRTARGRGGGTEFDQLREYSPDDEFRRIDWAATARTGRATVRAYRAERNQTVIMLLDNGRVMAGRVDDVPRVEHAMDAAMALTTVATGLGDRVGLVAFDRRVRAVVPPSARRTQLAAVTEAMFRLEPELVESDYRGAFVETVARFRRRTLLVVLTELSEAAVDEGLLPAMPVVARHHLVLVAGVQDPDVVALATRPVDRDDPDGPYRRAAAVEALEQRRRAAARLGANGASVVDCPPREMASQLTHAYLKAKATGRL